MNLLLLIIPFVAWAATINAQADVDQVCLVRAFGQVQQAIQECTNIVLSNFTVPAGKGLVLKLQEGTTVTFRGNITFEFVNWEGPLIGVYGSHVIIQGEPGHVLDGQGHLYWDGLGSWGTLKPKFMRVEVSNNSIFRDLHFHNAPMHGIDIKNSHDTVFTNFLIDNAAGAKGVAPAGHEGHNTDGFGVGTSSNIVIKDSVVYNQDDCVALNSGTNIHVSNLLCHGSHGLSLSVGFSNDSIEINSLSNVVIENSTIIDAMDGIHVKTHIDAGVGLLSNVTYRNIVMLGSYSYGIAIEQNYTNSPGNSSNHGALPLDNIPIKGLNLYNIQGTVLNTSVPYYVVCAEGGCSDWEWEDVFVYGLKDSACVNFHPNGIDCVDYQV